MTNISEAAGQWEEEHMHSVLKHLKVGVWTGLMLYQYFLFFKATVNNVQNTQEQRITP